jgi:hypothetical protein
VESRGTTLAMQRVEGQPSSRIETRALLTMSISATRASTAPLATTPPPMRRAGDFVAEKDSDVVETVALTRTEPVQRSVPVSSRVARPDASFIAHLIATAEQAPQTRELRRAAVADVEAAYRAVANAYATGSMSGRIQRVI